MSNVIRKLQSLHSKLNQMLLEMKQDINQTSISRSDDKALVFDHSLCHTFWNKLKKKSIKGWNRAKVKSVHTMIVREMFKRGFKHTHTSDLDDSLPGDLKAKTEDNSKENQNEQ